MAINDGQSLPVELLSMIVDQADVEDLSNLRLVSQAFNVFAEPRFFIENFKERVYCLSSDGLRRLIHDSTDPRRARHMKTIIIEQGGNNRNAAYHSNIRQALQNLASHGNQISVGVRHSTDLTRMPSVQQSKNQAATSICRFMTTTLLPALTATNFTLNTLYLDFEDTPVDLLQPIIPAYKALQRYIRSVARQPRTYTITIRFFNPSAINAEMGFMSFSPTNGFTAKNVSLWHLHSFGCFWAFDLTFTSASLTNCCIDMHILGRICGHQHTLRSVRLENVCLFSRQWASGSPLTAGDWRYAMRWIHDHATALDHIGVRDLWYGDVFVQVHGSVGDQVQDGVWTVRGVTNVAAFLRLLME